MFSRIALLAAIVAAVGSTTVVNAVAVATTEAPAPIVAIQETVLDSLPEEEESYEQEEEEELFDEASDETYELEEEAAEEEEEEEIEAEYEAEDEANYPEEIVATTPCPSESQEEESVPVVTPCASEEYQEEESVPVETPCPSEEYQEEESVPVETPCPSEEYQEEESVPVETPCPSESEEEVYEEETLIEETVPAETPCPSEEVTETSYYEHHVTTEDPECDDEIIVTEDPCEIEMPPVPEPTTPCVIDMEDPIVTDDDTDTLLPEDTCNDHVLQESETVNALINRVCGGDGSLQCSLGSYPSASNADGVSCPADFTLKTGDTLNVCCTAPTEAVEEEEEVYATNLSVKSSSGLGATGSALVATGAVAGVCALAGAAIYMRRKKAQNDAAYAVSTPGDNII